MGTEAKEQRGSVAVATDQAQPRASVKPAITARITRIMNPKASGQVGRFCGVGSGCRGTTIVSLTPLCSTPG